MNKLLFTLIMMLILLLATTGFSKTYYVSSGKGSDANPGSEEQPFKTIQKAANVVQAGDICWIAEGIYRETVKLKTSGKEGQPIVFKAMEDHEVVISGTELITANWIGYFDYNRTWSDEGEKTFQSQGINGKRNFTQLYVDGELMFKVAGAEKLEGPGKWFFDYRGEDGDWETRLVLWPPEEETVAGMDPGYSSPLNYTIEARIRDYAFVADGISYVHALGIQYFASENKTDKCDNCEFE
jgi:hypothetical protein